MCIRDSTHADAGSYRYIWQKDHGGLQYSGIERKFWESWVSEILYEYWMTKSNSLFLSIFQNFQCFKITTFVELHSSESILKNFPCMIFEKIHTYLRRENETYSLQRTNELGGTLILKMMRVKYILYEGYENNSSTRSLSIILTLIPSIFTWYFRFSWSIFFCKSRGVNSSLFESWATSWSWIQIKENMRSFEVGIIFNWMKVWDPDRYTMRIWHSSRRLLALHTHNCRCSFENSIDLLKHSR